MASAESTEFVFDHTDPALAPQFHEVCARLRQTCPVVHSDRMGGFWAATRYQDVARVAKDHEYFTSTNGVTFPTVPRSVKLAPIEFDPPEHGKYRKLVRPFFTPERIVDYGPILRAVTTELIDSFIDRRSCDLFEEMATPLPPIALAAVMDFPREDWSNIREWTARMVGGAVAQDPEDAQRYAGLLFEYLGGQIAQRRGKTGSDVLTALANAEVDGRPLSDDEVLGMARLLTVAGHETTVAGIGNTLAYLALDPVAQQRLIDDPALIPDAVEESLRYESPVMCLARSVAQPVELGDQQLETGDKIIMLWGSANRDEAIFPDPDTFDIDRQPYRHLAFGFGTHRCLGEHLARLEIQIVLEEILRRMPGFRLADGAAIERTCGLTRSITALPVVW